MRKLALVCLLAAAGCLAVAWQWHRHRSVHIYDVQTHIPADGASHDIAVLNYRGDLDPSDVSVTGTSAADASLSSAPGKVLVRFRAPVIPARSALVIHVRMQNFPLHISAEADNADSAGDGTPDWMRLHSAEDRVAFRQWVTELAERMADTPVATRPPEIADCASLLRYSYRESLRLHDGKWYAQFGPVAMPSLASVQQWTYPNTPVGTGLFRIRPGPYTPADATNGAFQEFADAKTLMQHNAFLLGRDLRFARPGDVLFFRVLEQESQYHSMIVTGEHGEWVVYHTGPIDGHTGEMRRVLLADLLHHPDFKWRPIAENANFLGVYRWNILRED